MPPTFLLADLYATSALAGGVRTARCRGRPYSRTRSAGSPPHHHDPGRRFLAVTSNSSGAGRAVPVAESPAAGPCPCAREPRVKMSVMARVTLQTLAEQLGVSRMTVSNAFSRPDQLSPDLRARILAAADDLGYVGPDPAARPWPRTTGAVGVLLTDSLAYAFTDDVATSFLGAVVDELAATGLALTLLPSDERHRRRPGARCRARRCARVLVQVRVGRS